VKGPDVIDRLTLGTLGAVLAATGAYGLARSYGAFGSTRAEDPLLLENVRSFVGRNHDWFWPGAFVVALALAFLGYLLLRAQIVPRRRGSAMHESDGADDIVVAPSAVGDAVGEDLERDPMITHARAGVTQADALPTIDLDLTVPDDVAFVELRRHIETEAIARAQAAMESPPVRTRVVVSLGEPAGRHLD
jgi:hypothetical protein